jgi:hypothetical protein
MDRFAAQRMLNEEDANVLPSSLILVAMIMDAPSSSKNVGS